MELGPLWAWLAGATLVLGVLVGVWLARLAPKRRVARARRVGRAGEDVAERLLTRAGYRVEARQVTGEVRLRVDGQPQRFTVRADYLVRRKRRRYIAEVKSTSDTGTVANRDTRRQLLEYAYAFDVDGVLLVDAARREVREVVFEDA